MKTQLFSAFIYGLNYRPFGTGGFSQVKRRMANVFMATESSDSTIFMKYCERIALDLSLPCQTQDERQHVFEACLDLPSLRQKGGLPKLGRWFSWNSVADDQMVEFNTLKMLFEHNLQAETDPDANPVGFDMRAIEAAGRTHLRLL